MSNNGTSGNKKLNISHGALTVGQYCNINRVARSIIFAEWTGKCKNGRVVSMRDLPINSTLELLWRCSEGHEWYASIYDRTRGETKIGVSKCPYCSGRIVDDNNRLSTWVENNSLGEIIKKEWTGMDTTDTPFSMDDVAYTSKRTFRFKCEHGHTYTRRLDDRVLNNNGCGVCSRSVATWCSNNGDFGELIRMQWTGVNSDNDNIDIYTISHSSSMLMFWKCAYGHIWKSTIKNRLIFHSMCPSCRKNRLLGTEDNKIRKPSADSLYSWCVRNKPYGALLLSEWTGFDAYSKPKYIEYTKYTSKAPVIWKCEKGHTWVDRICTRVENKTTCVVCNANKLSDKHNVLFNNGSLISFDTWCKLNKTNGQEIRQMWVGNTYDGKVIDPEYIKYDSSEKLFWKCEKGHTWVSSVIGITSGASTCPECKLQNKNSEVSLYEWCEQSGDYGQQLKSEFTGKTHDGSIVDMSIISWLDRESLLWECQRKHRWYESARRRVVYKTVCPTCKVKKLANCRGANGNFYNWALDNNEDTILMWTGKKKNRDTDDLVKMWEVGCMSTEEFWFCCKNKHEFLDSPKNMIKYAGNCEKCTKEKYKRLLDDIFALGSNKYGDKIKKNVTKIYSSDSNSITYGFELVDHKIIFDVLLIERDMEKIPACKFRGKLAESLGYKYIAILVDYDKRFKRKAVQGYTYYVESADKFSAEQCYKVVKDLLK